jgi:hypothetical protein
MLTRTVTVLGLVVGVVGADSGSDKFGRDVTTISMTTQC